MSAPRLSVGSVAVLMWIGCGACGSVPVLHFDDGDADVDAAVDAGPCTPTGAEICDDGIDNDCNGAIDCADTACTPHWVCAATPPDGWTAVGLSAMARDDCPEGFGAATDVQTVAGKSGAPVCDCNCGGAGACQPGGIVMTAGGTATCDDESQTFVASAACTKINGPMLSTNSYVRANAGSPMTCSPTAPGIFAPLANGRTCAVDKLGGGCKASQVCVPRGGTAVPVCIEKTGSVTCPTSWPNSTHVGDSAADSRACSTCTCTSSPCAGNLQLFDDTACTASANLEVAATTTCTKGKNTTFTVKGYTATMSGGCIMAAAATGTGTLTFQDEETICCK